MNYLIKTLVLILLIAATYALPRRTGMLRLKIYLNDI
jgi:hypothetical protein